ncbi:hypothetical protein ACP26L_20840 [Paenibacillus sp. S-38]
MFACLYTVDQKFLMGLITETAPVGYVHDVSIDNVIDKSHMRLQTSL